MQTLILTTEGMAAYGLQTFDVQRRVNHFPTRSAVMGLLGAAKGIKRDQHGQLFALSQELTIAVQVRQQGQKIVDFHTVQSYRNPRGKIQQGPPQITYREYWCDTKFNFAISAHKSVIEDLKTHVKSPVFTLFQGRKSCPLTRPLYNSLVEAENPAVALMSLGEGLVYSDVTAQHQVAMTQLRDLTTPRAHEYAMRQVYICGVNNEFAH